MPIVGLVVLTLYVHLQIAFCRQSQMNSTDTRTVVPEHTNISVLPSWPHLPRNARWPHAIVTICDWRAHDCITRTSRRARARAHDARDFSDRRVSQIEPGTCRTHTRAHPCSHAFACTSDIRQLVLHRLNAPYVNVELGASGVHLVTVHALQTLVGIVCTHVHRARVLAHKLTITLCARIFDAMAIMDLCTSFTRPQTASSHTVLCRRKCVTCANRFVHTSHSYCFCCRCVRTCFSSVSGDEYCLQTGETSCVMDEEANLLQCAHRKR